MCVRVRECMYMCACMCPKVCFAQTLGTLSKHLLEVTGADRQTDGHTDKP